MIACSHAMLCHVMQVENEDNNKKSFDFNRIKNILNRYELVRERGLREAN